MQKKDMVADDRQTARVWLDADMYDDAEAVAHERHAENGTDEHTRDPDNIIAGRIRGMAAEAAFNEWAVRTFGASSVEWTDREGGATEPYDFVVNGVKVDVQARNDANDYDSYAVLKEKYLADGKRGDAAIDAYVCVVTDDDAREHVIWGYAEADRLHDPQAIAPPWLGFPQKTYYLDDGSPYFKCVAELKRRLRGGN